MRRMDGFSAFFLNDEQPGVYTHTLKIAFLDVSDVAEGFSYDQFRESCLRRLDVVPFARWKFLRVPFGLHHPVWVDDPDFDIDYHFRRIDCPAPGDRRALCTLISQIYASPLDHSKPLWQCWVVEGLEDQQVALVALLHHAYTDGSGAARILQRFFSALPESSQRESRPWKPEPLPGRFRLLADALIDLPVTWARTVPKLLRGIRAVRRLRRDFAREGKALPPTPMHDTRDSPFNVLLGYGRTFVFDTYPLEDIHRTSRALDVTINDLFLAAAALACRRFMLDRGFDPDRGPLVATVPVSRRPPPEQDDCIGVMTSVDYLALPVHIADPGARLHAAHRASEIMKEHIKAAQGIDMSGVLEITPPLMVDLMHWNVRRNKGKRGIGGNLAVSNVAGPRDPLYLGRMRLANWVSIGHLTHGTALNVTVWSYADRLNLSIIADKRVLPDGWILLNHFRDAIAEYGALPDHIREAAGSPEDVP
jgi:diacylglycerol O-acyltransferase / wax synthase